MHFNEPPSGAPVERKRRPVWPWWLAVAVVVIAIASYVTVKQNHKAKEAAGHAVVYTVTAPPAAVPFDCSGQSCVPTTDDMASSINYLTANGSQQANGQSLPWTYSAQLRALRSGAAVVVTAQRASGDDGTITCTIKVDGVVAATNTSSGQYAVVTCSAPLS